MVYLQACLVLLPEVCAAVDALGLQGAVPLGIFGGLEVVAPLLVHVGADGGDQHEGEHTNHSADGDEALRMLAHVGGRQLEQLACGHLVVVRAHQSEVG